MNLRKILTDNDITICPEIFDCLSAKAVELCHFQAVILSSAEFSISLQGNPDLGFLTLDDLVRASYYISRATPLPLIVDADDCFGSPLQVYNACRRMVQAGAQGILIMDAEPCSGKVLPLEDAVAKYKAARTAMDGTDCVLIARCDSDPRVDIEETIRRCNEYHRVGADITLAVKLNRIKDDSRTEIVKRIGREVEGWKMYPDLGASDGKPDVDVDELAKYGYKLVGIHYLMYAAMEGMLDYGHHIFNDRSNIYFNKYNQPGCTFDSAAQFFGLEDGYWPEMEARFVDDPARRITEKKRSFVMNELKGCK